MPTIHYGDIVSLCHPITPEMPHWPGDPATEVDTVATLGRDGYALRRFAMGEHSGTHINAPNSFWTGGRAMHELPARDCVMPLVVLDGRDRAAADADWQLAIADLLVWEERHGSIPAGALVALWTGWQERWRDRAAFLNADADGRLHFPGVGVAAAQWLLDQRQIAALAIDTHGVDAGASEGFAVNRLVLGAGGQVVECLANLNRVPPVGAITIVAGLPLVGGTGSPVGVLALVP